MAAAGPRSQKPVGSAAWISSEKENVMQMVDQEMEEVEYPVSHELAWLNEHMADVFSNDQFNFTEVFKTPGKLRGKTPRTARKRNVDEPRVPLSEIFSSARKQPENKPTASPSTHRSPAKPTALHKTSTVNSSAKEPAEKVSHPQYPNPTQNLNSFPEYNTDSGYHGMPEDDDMVLPDVQPDSQTSTQPLDSQETLVEHHIHRSSVARVEDDSFHSAQENIRLRGATVEPMEVDSTPKHKIEVQIPTKQSKEKEPVREPVVEDTPAAEPAPESSPAKKREPEVVSDGEQGEQDEQEVPARSSPAKPAVQTAQQEEKDANENRSLDDTEEIGSPSDDSSLDRPLIRKSSLTFASLPAREPLTKRSLGGSGMAKLSAGRQTGGLRTAQAAVGEDPERDDKMDVDEEASRDLGTESRASRLHSKSSTQRLHEKISMLGKMKPSRPSKSIPSAPGLASNQVTYPELPAVKPDEKQDTSQESRETPAPEPMEVDNDDWIKPMGSAQRPALRKSQTMDVMEQLDQADTNEPAKGARYQGATNHSSIDTDMARPKTSASMFSPRTAGHQKSASVSNFPVGDSTTPTGSPGRQDGPLSAPKSRLQSIMRSAKGLFSSSGGATAAARVESVSPETPRTAARNRANTHTAGVSQVPRPAQFSSPIKQGRRTRSSTEREERRKQQELEDRRREEEESKAREQEKQKAAQLKAAKEKASAEPEARAAPAPASSPKRLPRPQRQASKEPESSNDPGMKYPSQTSKPGRPVRPARAPVQQPKPQPVSIRVGSALSRQMPLAASSISSGAQESNPPAPASASKPPAIKKKASNSSLHTAPSNSSFKSSVSSQSQRKAQLASERKKEQEEREARRKDEQKRDLERKRAAQQQQEEARRQELRSRAEAERKERERERAAIEDSKKTAHMQAIEKRRLENARRLERQGSQQPEMQDKPAPQPPRGDAGPARPASRLGSVQQYGRPINQPQPNPAKPPKRALDDEAGHRPAPRKPSATIQPSGEAKRRRTEDEQNHQPVRPTMAPPIRQSNIRKEPTQPSIFGGQPSAAQSGSSIFKPGQPRGPAHPMDMAKYTTGKIPFAEPSVGPSQKAPAKPSPKYPNGENIALPEIATDSEDEDSDSEMLPVPKWAQPKELESLLRQQEGVEVDSIFGPIAPFSLEETFKSDKKVKKFRERTSSANWNGPDGLTQDEIRKDLSERQRMKLNGGWSFTD